MFFSYKLTGDNNCFLKKMLAIEENNSQLFAPNIVAR